MSNQTAERNTSYGSVPMWVHALFIGILTIWTFFLSDHMIYNWDIGPYIACVLEWEGRESSMQGADITANILHEECQSNVCDKLTGDPEYIGKNRFYIEKTEYEKLIRYYKVRPLYIASIYLSRQVGFDYTSSTIVPNMVAFLFFGAFLAFWMLRVLPWKPAFALTLLCLLFPACANLVRYSSPDGISNLLLLIMTYLFLEKRERNGFMLFMVCSLVVLVRIDNLIFCLLIYGYPLAKGLIKSRRRMAIHSFLAIMALGALALVFIPLMTDIGLDWHSDFLFAATKDSYLLALAIAFWDFLYSPLAVLFSVFLFLAVYVKNSGFASRKGFLILAFFVFILIKTMIHPGFVMRQYSFIFASCLLFLCQWAYYRHIGSPRNQEVLDA